MIAASLPLTPRRNRHHIRAVLFDLDGVIVYTDRFHEMGWRRMAEEEGWQVSSELIHSLRGVGRMDSLKAIADHNGITLAPQRAQELAERKNNYYKEFVKEIGEQDLLPGSLEFIQSLRSLGISIALCSSSKNAPAVLKLLNIEDLFDTVVCGLDVARSKPDPEVFTLAAERLGIPRFHCLVLEDAPSGVEAAKRAGMKCVGVGTPEGLPEAPSLIRSYDEIDTEALLDSGRPYRPVPHDWELREGPFRPTRSLYWESMLAVTNGVLGVRGNLEEKNEGLPTYPATQINGIVGYSNYHYMWAFPGFPERGHSVLNACEWVRIDLQVDGETFSMTHPGLEVHDRWLDLKTGIYHRSFTWKTASGIGVSVRSRRLASMTRRHFAAHEYEVRVSCPCQVKLTTTIDAAPPSQHQPHSGIACQDWKLEGQFARTTQFSPTSKQKVASAFRQQVDGAPGISTIRGNQVVSTFERRLGPNETMQLERTAVFCSSVESGNPLTQTSALLDSLPSNDVLFREQRCYWQDYWKQQDILIEGDALDQLGVRLSLFHNRQSNPEDGFRSISANGQTGDNYGGHIFWDTEMYIAQPFYYTEPEAVRSLLKYRYRILDQAREQARRMQGKGALYSWNSITGEECAHVYEASTAEYHLQSAIAWAVSRYVDATNDQEFLQDMGAEMVFETARFLRHRGCFSPAKGDRFCLNVVCGPNEYTCGVDNNAYTNYLAQWHFEYAAKLYEDLKSLAPLPFARLQREIGVTDHEAAGWRDAAQRMYLPKDERMGIIPQDDNFLGRDPVDMSKIPLHTDMRSRLHPLNLWRAQLIKQADTVLLLFLFDHKFDLETIRRSYDFYEPITNHGSSLSASIHSIVANRLRLDDDAYHFFRESALMDINDLKGNTSGGVHSACLGGTWMALVNGFGGMRDTPDGLRLAPKIPSKWKRLCFQLQYRGTRFAVDIIPGQTKLSHLEGSALPLTLGERKMRLEVQSTLIV